MQSPEVPEPAVPRISWAPLGGSLNISGPHLLGQKLGIITPALSTSQVAERVTRDNGSKSTLTCVMGCNSATLFAGRAVKSLDAPLSQTWTEL